MVLDDAASVLSLGPWLCMPLHQAASARPQHAHGELASLDRQARPTLPNEPNQKSHTRCSPCDAGGLQCRPSPLQPLPWRQSLQRG